jgi:hypothetical protein
VARNSWQARLAGTQQEASEESKVHHLEEQQFDAFNPPAFGQPVQPSKGVAEYRGNIVRSSASFGRNSRLSRTGSGRLMLGRASTELSTPSIF